MLVGLLGVLKAGAGYVPIDPAYPAERIAFTLKDSAPRAVLGEHDCLALLGSLDAPLIDLNDPQLSQQPTHNPARAGLLPSHLAYVIYTSGSTGLPKGVMVEHGNMARLFTATESWFDFNRLDTWALFHSFAFDFSVWEIWGALAYGGRLLIVPQRVSRSPDECYALLCRSGVSVLNQTPSAFRQLIAAQGRSALQHSLRQVIFGGEALEPGLLKPWYARIGNAGTRLVNMYGITETTVHVHRNHGARHLPSLAGRRCATAGREPDRRAHPRPAGVCAGRPAPTRAGRGGRRAVRGRRRCGARATTTK